MKIDIEEFQKYQTSKDSKIWDVGNDVLYRLCRKHPLHTDKGAVIAKIWLIGRSYAAAIERRPKSDSKRSSDRFYEDVAEKLINSQIDREIKRLPKTEQLSKENIKIIMDVHKFLTTTFYRLTSIYKVSLASKYLHFHRPITPIYDSRAKKSMSGIFEKNIDIEYKDMIKYVEKNRLSGNNTANDKLNNVEKEYLHFVIKIYCVQQFLKKETGELFSPREIDKYLLERFESR
ncbi:MAG: hypothetical protein HQL30_03840 [Candidatus Omnitrophica bacterium]|nr:hypothetical protein [Candidatus Omnitrophota bacterium]